MLSSLSIPFRGPAHLASCALLAALCACGSDRPPENAAVEEKPAAEAVSAAAEAVAEAPADDFEAILAVQPETIQSRYAARHPAQTLRFFGVEPGMTVVETDPGTGWYSRILHAYLGTEGRLIGADYAVDMYPLFEYYSNDELAAKASWAERWPTEVSTTTGAGATLEAYHLGALPKSLDGGVDVVLFVRSLHNLADFEAEGAYLSTALGEAFRVLKPGGVVGVVQHMGPETHSDEWASGANGYLKKSFVIARLEEAGFVLDGETAINENPLDTPTEDDYVWRLAPTLEEVEDPVLAESYIAIGESSRMTLRFVKPTSS